MSFFTLWDRWLSNLELRAYSILLPVYEMICRPVRRAYFEFKQIKRNKKAGIDWKKAQQNFATENNSTAEQVNSSNERPLDLSAYARVEYTSIDRAEYLKILSQSMIPPNVLNPVTISGSAKIIVNKKRKNRYDILKKAV
jgi:hypothetical protein